jgi:hypothetical protein
VWLLPVAILALLAGGVITAARTTSRGGRIPASIQRPHR